jgi:hypothetical protein
MDQSETFIWVDSAGNAHEWCCGTYALTCAADEKILIEYLKPESANSIWVDQLLIGEKIEARTITTGDEYQALDEKRQTLLEELYGEHGYVPQITHHLVTRNYHAVVQLLKKFASVEAYDPVLIFIDIADKEGDLSSMRLADWLLVCAHEADIVGKVYWSEYDTDVRKIWFKGGMAE